jgi:hypothetical protein
MYWEMQSEEVYHQDANVLMDAMRREAENDRIENMIAQIDQLPTWISRLPRLCPHPIARKRLSCVDYLLGVCMILLYNKIIFDATFLFKSGPVLFTSYGMLILVSLRFI